MLFILGVGDVGGTWKFLLWTRKLKSLFMCHLAWRKDGSVVVWWRQAPHYMWRECFEYIIGTLVSRSPFRSHSKPCPSIVCRLYICNVCMNPLFAKASSEFMLFRSANGTTMIHQMNIHPLYSPRLWLVNKHEIWKLSGAYFDILMCKVDDLRSGEQI